MTDDLNYPGYRRSLHYTMYRKITPEQRANIAAQPPLAYAASNQLGRVEPGDVLWLVNVYLNRLWLVGRLNVMFVVDNIEVAQELADPHTDDWEEADWYAISSRYRVEPLRLMDISGTADQLHFYGPSPRLTVSDGRIVKPQELRSLRELTEESADLLEALWHAETDTPQTTADFLELTEDDLAYTEGKQVTRTLQQRQRNRKLVEHAKTRFKARYGRLYCEVCGFDFTAYYGVEYIEAHHNRPIASLTDEDETTVDELGMLCANCHRMIHSRTPPLTREELKAMIENTKAKPYDHDHSTRD